MVNYNQIIFFVCVLLCLLKSNPCVSLLRGAIQSSRRTFLLCRVTMGMEDLKTIKSIKVWIVFCAQQEQGVCLVFLKKDVVCHVPGQHWELNQHVLGGNGGELAPKPHCCLNTNVDKSMCVSVKQVFEVLQDCASDTYCCNLNKLLHQFIFINRMKYIHSFMTALIFCVFSKLLFLTTDLTQLQI